MIRELTIGAMIVLAVQNVDDWRVIVVALLISVFLRILWMTILKWNT